MADKVSEDLGQKVLSGNATLEEMREFQVNRDLKGLPGYRTYEKESNFTKEWQCPQCGQSRPVENADPEQEGQMGSLRRKAGYRPPR